jgi:hypothetical protein
MMRQLFWAGSGMPVGNRPRAQYEFGKRDYSGGATL